MAFRVLGLTEQVLGGYSSRKGLEGPFPYPNGKVLYYDPKEGKYWDPTTDFYLDNAEIDVLNQDLVKTLSR